MTIILFSVKKFNIKISYVKFNNLDKTREIFFFNHRPKQFAKSSEYIQNVLKPLFSIKLFVDSIYYNYNNFKHFVYF